MLSVSEKFILVMTEVVEWIFRNARSLVTLVTAIVAYGSCNKRSGNEIVHRHLRVARFTTVNQMISRRHKLLGILKYQ